MNFPPKTVCTVVYVVQNFVLKKTEEFEKNDFVVLCTRPVQYQSTRYTRTVPGTFVYQVPGTRTQKTTVPGYKWRPYGLEAALFILFIIAFFGFSTYRAIRGYFCVPVSFYRDS